MSDPAYLAAIVTFLNRETGTQTAMTYPITRIELLSQPSEANPNGEPRRVFVVDGDRWKEVH
jgi:hypothetical protein